MGRLLPQKVMAKAIEEMIGKINHMREPEFGDILELASMFREDTERRNQELAEEVRSAISKIMTLEVLRSFNKHIIATSSVTFLLLSEAVADFETKGLYTLSQEDSPCCFVVEVILVTLVDQSRIFLASITENFKEQHESREEIIS